MKQFFKLSLLIMLFVASAAAAFAQRTVTGTVTSASDGSPLIGATVIVNGTNEGTITDIDGKFSIMAKPTDMLIVSYTGFASTSVPVGEQANLTINLTEGLELTAVVVTGYTAQQKKDLTGAVSTVNTEDLKTIPSSNINSQLQGRVAGVTVSGDGRPGNAAKVRIRGFTSIAGFNDPLYVVDGVPTQDISNLNPNDVQSISVLKDAGAASIYGSRAANGVVLVTTKKGENQGVKVSYDMYVGTQVSGSATDDLLDAQGYADLQWLVYKNDRLDGTFDGNNDGELDFEVHPIYGSSKNASPTLPAWGADTDWWEVLTRDALITNHDLSFSGGNSNARFYAGLNYFDQDGIAIHNFAKRYSARVNSEFKMANKRLTIGENLTITGRKGNGIEGNGGEEGIVTGGIYRTQPLIPAYITVPVQGVTHDFQVGDFGGTGIAPRLGNSRSILAQQVREAADRETDVRLLGSMFLDLELIPGLNARSTVGGSFQNYFNTDWVNATYENAENIATSSYSETGGYNADWVWTNTLTFNKEFGSHKLLLVGGHEAVKYGIGRGLQASRAGYFTDEPFYRILRNGSQITAATSWFNTPITLSSYFLRGDYSFNNRYYISGTIRRDGSSVFSPDNRFGVFPSVSLGWRVSDLIDAEFLSDMKLRGGYGRMGNSLPVTAVNQFSLFGSDAGSTNYDLNGTGNSSQQGFAPTRIGNTGTKWETQTTINAGFDASLFNNVLQLSFDWYKKSAEDLLFTPQFAAVYGAAGKPALNVAEIENTGVDLQLDYRTKITPDLGLDVGITFTSYKNKIVKVTNDIDYFDAFFGASRIGTFNRNQVGQPISSFYGYNVVGLFQDQGAVDAAAVQDGAEPGFFQFEDVDASDTISPEDRVFIGDPNPDFTYGVNLGLNFKGFDLSAFFFGSQGNDIFNYNRWWLDFWPSFQGQKSQALLQDSWTPGNTGATVPKASNKSNFSTNTQSTSYYVEDGSFLRLRTLQIGYTFPKTLFKGIGVDGIRLYVQGTNLFTITNYSGLDPDINNGGDQAFGVDLGNYPLVKQYLVGVHVGF